MIEFLYIPTEKIVNEQDQEIEIKGRMRGENGNDRENEHSRDEMFGWPYQFVEQFLQIIKME